MHSIFGRIHRELTIERIYPIRKIGVQLSYNETLKKVDYPFSNYEPFKD